MLSMHVSVSDLGSLRSPTLGLSTFPSHFPWCIFHCVEFIQVLRVEFVPGFYQPRPDDRV